MIIPVNTEKTIWNSNMFSWLEKIKTVRRQKEKKTSLYSTKDIYKNSTKKWNCKYSFNETQEKGRMSNFTLCLQHYIRVCSCSKNKVWRGNKINPDWKRRNKPAPSHKWNNWSARKYTGIFSKWLEILNKLKPWFKIKDTYTKIHCVST